MELNPWKIKSPGKVLEKSWNSIFLFLYEPFNYAWSWSKAVSYAFGRKEEGTVLGDIGACLVWVHFEFETLFIYNIYGEICGIPKNVPRFLKSVFHIPEEYFAQFSF